MIQVSNISKKYGKELAVDNVSFELKRGEIVGFLGTNGAGKSTTMKMIAGILKPDSGNISIFGENMMESPLIAKKHIGFLSEDNPLYENMYVKEYLEYVENCYPKKQKQASLVDKTIEDTNLNKEFRKKIHALSKGNRQRLGLAQALIHEPNFLILDEPTSGLDPNQQLEIQELISNLSKSKIILFSTHILQEVTSICNRIILINKGKIVLDQDTNTIASIEETFYTLTK